MLASSGGTHLESTQTKLGSQSELRSHPMEGVDEQSHAATKATTTTRYGC